MTSKTWYGSKKGKSSPLFVLGAIRKIEIFADDKYVTGIEINGKRFGSNAGKSGSGLLSLYGELIMGAKIRHNKKHIQYLEFLTNQGRTVTGGKEGKIKTDLTGNHIQKLEMRFGEYVNGIFLEYSQVSGGPVLNLPTNMPRVI